jgi:hypothetical protein
MSALRSLIGLLFWGFSLALLGQDVQPFSAYFEKDSLKQYQYALSAYSDQTYDLVIRQKKTSQTESAGDAQTYREVFLTKVKINDTRRKNGILEIQVWHSNQRGYTWKADETQYLQVLLNFKVGKIMYKPIGEVLLAKKNQSALRQEPRLTFDPEELTMQEAVGIAVEFFISKYEKLLGK